MSWESSVSKENWSGLLGVRKRGFKGRGNPSAQLLIFSNSSHLISIYFDSLRGIDVAGSFRNNAVAHGNSKDDSRGFIRSSSVVFEKISDALSGNGVLSKPSVVEVKLAPDARKDFYFDEEVRNRGQIKNLKHKLFGMNTQQLMETIKLMNEERESERIVHFHCFDQGGLSVIAFFKPLVNVVLKGRKFLKNSDFRPPQMDLTFNLGTFFVTLIVCRNVFLEGSPLTPLAMLLHQKKNAEAFVLLFSKLNELCDQFCSKTSAIVVDGDKAEHDGVKRGFASCGQRVSVLECFVHLRERINHLDVSEEVKIVMKKDLLGIAGVFSKDRDYALSQLSVLKKEYGEKGEKWIDSQIIPSVDHFVFSEREKEGYGREEVVSTNLVESGNQRLKNFIGLFKSRSLNQVDVLRFFSELVKFDYNSFLLALREFGSKRIKKDFKHLFSKIDHTPCNLCDSVSSELDRIEEMNSELHDVPMDGGTGSSKSSFAHVHDVVIVSDDSDEDDGEKAGKNVNPSSKHSIFVTTDFLLSKKIDVSDLALTNFMKEKKIFDALTNTVTFAVDLISKSSRILKSGRVEVVVEKEGTLSIRKYTVPSDSSGYHLIVCDKDKCGTCTCKSNSSCCSHKLVCLLLEYFLGYNLNCTTLFNCLKTIKPTGFSVENISMQGRKKNQKRRGPPRKRGLSNVPSSKAIKQADKVAHNDRVRRIKQLKKTTRTSKRKRKEIEEKDDESEEEKEKAPTKKRKLIIKLTKPVVKDK